MPLLCVKGQDGRCCRLVHPSPFPSCFASPSSAQSCRSRSALIPVRQKPPALSRSSLAPVRAAWLGSGLGALGEIKELQLCAVLTSVCSKGVCLGNTNCNGIASANWSYMANACQVSPQALRFCCSR